MRIVVFILFLFTSVLQGQGHYIYIKDYNNNPIANHPVKIYRRTSSVTPSFTAYSYRTHYGTGSTSQYGQFANSSSDMDKMVNSSYAATTYLGSLTTSSTSIISWSNASTPRNLGLSIPSNGEYFSVSVTTLFTASETGYYYFGINSDDGSDLYIGGTLVTSYYGGHGMSGYQYGSVYLIKGSSYWMTARMQEYGGGEGLAVVWKKPSGSSYSIWADEIGTLTWSSWSLYTTLYTNSSGYIYSNYSTSGAEYYAVVDATTTPSFTNQPITSKILNQTALTGLDYWMWDLNNDSEINIADAYYFYARKSGRFNSFLIPDYRLFTSSQYSTLANTPSNLKSSYPGYTSITTSTLSSGTTYYYLIKPGNY